jgi:hypothetical protein
MEHHYSVYHANSIKVLLKNHIVFIPIVTRNLQGSNDMSLFPYKTAAQIGKNVVAATDDKNQIQKIFITQCTQNDYKVIIAKKNSVEHFEYHEPSNNIKPTTIVTLNHDVSINTVRDYATGTLYKSNALK